MRYFYSRIPVADETRPEPATAAPRVKVRITNAKEAQRIPRSPADNLRQAPATPLMLTPTVAWRMLCARTGGGVTLQCFYGWIRNGSLFSIRMGKRIFVPVDKLDDLIEICLAGEDLKSAPG